MGYIQNLRHYVGHQPIVAIGATVIVTDEDGAVLLQRRSDFSTWGLPGGALTKICRVVCANLEFF